MARSILRRSGLDRKRTDMGDITTAGHVTYALRNSRVYTWPFPHFYARNVFPEDVYWKIQETVSNRTDYVAGDKFYNGRKFAEADHIPEVQFMLSPEFARNVAKIFHPYMAERFADRQCKISSDLRLVRDGRDYHIGPHTDAVWKVVSLLFYLPLDGWNRACGTSVYLPKDPTFTCGGGPHYEFEDFDRIFTAPFVPNSCFGFFKTNNSFHGVEPIDRDIQRDVLLYNIYEGK